MSWSNAYVGTPYLEFGRSAEGCDCWGLVHLVYARELGISLPDYLGYGSAEEHAEINALISRAETEPVWSNISATPRAFDIAVFRRGRLASHVGIVVRPGLMLHMVGEDCAKHEAFETGRWGNRLKGVYRHVDAPVEGGVK